MSPFLLKGDTKSDGVATDGLTCVAYAESRFPVDGSGNVIPPVQGSAVPDADPPDGGPVTSGGAFGGQGQWQIQVPDAGNYFVGCSFPFNPSVIAWEGPLMATPHTSKQGWTSIQTFGNTRSIVGTTVAAGSNGVTLPTGTIDVLNTAGFSSGPGHILIYHPSAPKVANLVAYTALSGGNSLTGCTGGSMTLATNDWVLQAYLNGANRRLIFASIGVRLVATSDTAYAWAFAQIGGTLTQVAVTGIDAWQPTGTNEFYAALDFPVDPGGSYGLYGVATGTASISANAWTEADF